MLQVGQADEDKSDNGAHAAHGDACDKCALVGDQILVVLDDVLLEQAENDRARVVDNTKVSTRSSYNHAAKGSISGQALIRRDSDAETVTSGSADTVGHELRRSGSEASILTVLCDAVQQPYSPLGGRPDATITTSTLDHAGTPEASMIQSGEGMRSSFASSHRLSNPRLRRYGLLDPPVPDHFSRHMANREEDRETDGNGKDRAD